MYRYVRVKQRHIYTETYKLWPRSEDPVQASWKRRRISCWQDVSTV